MTNASGRAIPEVGPAGDTPAGQRVAAARLVETGQSYSLSVARFPGMPLFPGHPPFQVAMHRSPRGIRAVGAQPWGPPNEVGLGYMAEVVSATSHSGAHVDALAHMTIGDDNRWYGGATTDEFLTDAGPTVGDAAKLPPFFTRGVLLDVARHRKVDCLAAGSPISGAELAAVADAQGTEVREWDVVLIRTGYLTFWPDAEKMAAHKTPGPDLSAARWLLDRGVVATGTDTETYEVQPAPDRGSPANPQPVHTLLLIEHGIYLFESLYLEDIARDQVHEFLFVALPLKISGATGSMVDPVAVV
ncbi:MAG TPA: cyclase family protein [Candidatus Limnocylindrales bacterium]|nr:cyclase family protein [Candidatus Limnocylindrales bacterium]